MINLYMHLNSSIINIGIMISIINAKDDKNKYKIIQIDHFKLKLVWSQTASILHAFKLSQQLKHQTKTYLYQDNMIHSQIQHKNPKLNMIRLVFTSHWA